MRASYLDQQAAIVAACRTHGVLPVDGPFGDFSDDEGYRAQALRSATLGMVGKWAIHPKQVALANEVFTPSEKAVTEAREILAAMEEAKAKGTLFQTSMKYSNIKRFDEYFVARSVRR